MSPTPAPIRRNRWHKIAGSIAEFGFNVPCLIDDQGVLITGHGRLLAARHLGQAEVPVIPVQPSVRRPGARLPSGRQPDYPERILE
ncbi:MAG: DNA methylase [Xanthobacteraceae bacterium]|nr:MAG: DNA methylase [Xanthobacteraceae bacterium]